MEKGKLLVGMYELADGLRIPMWRAITSSQLCDIHADLVEKEFGGESGDTIDLFQG